MPREHSTTRSGDANATLSAPMYITHPSRVEWTFFGNHPAGAGQVAIEDGYGMLEVYVCMKCGLVEWYCHDVSSIPIHPHQMTEIVDYSSETPYR